METAAAVEVADASRILAAQGVLDAFGHVSQRTRGSADGFLMSRSKAPALVEPADILELGMSGQPLGHTDAPVFLERFIHSEIYRAKPEVGAVVHSHSPAVLPFTVVASARLRPICHVCGFLANVGAPFDLADFAGPDSDLLVSAPSYGEALATHFGLSQVVLMRGHGFTVVGATLQEAVFRAVYTVRNSEIQRAAMALGEPKYLSDGEAAACDRTTRSQSSRAWDLWMNDLGSPESRVDGASGTQKIR